MNLKPASLGAVWLQLLSDVVDAAEPVSYGGEAFRELAPAMLRIADDGLDDIDPAFRDPLAEARYLHKHREVNIVEPFRYSYGKRLRQWGDEGAIDQMRWAKEYLTERPGSRSVVLSLIEPLEEPGAVPCLTTVYLRSLRGTLQMSCGFRSQNVLTAYMNYLGLFALAREIATDTNLRCGVLTSYIFVPHCNEHDFGRIIEIVKHHDSIKQERRTTS